MPADTPLKRIIVLMPCYKAEKTVTATFNKIPRDSVTTVVISDDASPDNTFAVAQQLPAYVMRNEQNLRYGGNMKALLRKGLALGGDIFVEIHGDGQYDPSIIPEAIKALKPTDGMLLGSRLMKSGKALDHGMPRLKYIMNIVLTGIANKTLGVHLTEFQSGFRVYTRKFLEKTNFDADSNDHLFSFETILQALYHGFTITEIPVVCTYEPGVTQMNLKKGIKYTVEMMWALARYWLAKFGKSDPIFSHPPH